MRTFDQLNPMEQAVAAVKATNAFLTAVIEEGLRFNDKLNHDDLQARIDGAIAEAERMQTPWFAGEYVRDALGDDLFGFVLADVEDALYPDPSEQIIRLG